jgi:amidase
MAGVDVTDPVTAEQVGNVPRSYTRFLRTDALEGARIGVWREGTYDPNVSPEVDAMINDTIAALEAAGATVIDNIRIPIEPAYGPEFEALLCEFKTDIASYLDAYTGAGYPKTLQDLIDFNNANPELESGAPESDWNSLLFEFAESTGGRSDPACAAARAAATPVAQAAVDDTLAANDLDAIIAPTNGPAWVTDPVNGDLGGDFSTFVGSSAPTAIAGYAAMTVPAGYVGPLPLGITFIGGRWDEPTLIGFAYAFEQATQVRVPPDFIPTIGDDASVARQPSSRAKQKPDNQKTAVPGRRGTWRMPPLR